MRTAIACVVTMLGCATADSNLDVPPSTSDANVVHDAASSDTRVADSFAAPTPDTTIDAAIDSALDTVDGDEASDDAAKIPVCGDGVIDAGEVCDDGNTTGGDGCSADCTSVECSGTHVFEDATTHHCYMRSTDVVSRTDAAAKCAAWFGGYLARFQTADERTAAYPQLVLGGTDKLWFGLTSVAGAWTWDDGTAADAAALSWGSGEPNGDGDCVQWTSGDHYDDLACSGYKRDFVCEREPAGKK